MSNKDKTLKMTNDITIIKDSEQHANEKSLETCLREETVREQSKSARELFTSLQNELDELEGDLKDGLSYLDMKNDTLLSYMIDLCNIVLRKVRGDTISGHASVERSIYYRVILEKIKAIDQRLAYQLNKVITTSDDANEEDQGVNIKNLDIDIDSGDDEEEDDKIGETSDRGGRNSRDTCKIHDDDNTDEGGDDDEDGEIDDEDSEFDGSVDEDEEDQDLDDDEIGDSSDEDGHKPNKTDSKISKAGHADTKKPVGIYKPPKLRSVAYSEERGGKMTKRRRDYSEIYQDDDGNQDIIDESYVERDNERTRYEEENYTRLPDMNPKKAKRKLKSKEMALKGKKKFKGGKNKKKGGKW